MSNVPQHYVPKGLTKKMRKQQKRELKRSRKLYKKGKYHTRKKVKGYKKRKSSWDSCIRKVYKLSNKEKLSISKLAKLSKCKKSALKKIVKRNGSILFIRFSSKSDTAFLGICTFIKRSCRRTSCKSGLPYIKGWL